MSKHGAEMSNPEKPLRAYRISCADPDHGSKIRFAKNAKMLRGYSPGDECDCEYIDVKVRRDKDFDKYSPGPVTIEQYLQEGWYWTCHGCDSQVHADDNPLIIESYVLCGRDCVLRARKVWADTDLTKCHESVRSLMEALDAWLEKNPPIPEPTSDADAAFAGSRVMETGPVSIACMSPEARDLLDTIMDAYRKHYNAETHTASPDDVYQFTYWLCRYSGLVRPA